MIIDADIPDIQNYSVYYSNGMPIFGLRSYNTETCEGEVATAKTTRQMKSVNEDGSERVYLQAGEIEVKKVRFQGSYATYKGQRI